MTKCTSKGIILFYSRILVHYGKLQIQGCDRDQIMSIIEWSYSTTNGYITKTCLYTFNLTPLNPLLYKTGVYRGMHYFFLFLLKNIDRGYSLEPPRRGGSNECPQTMF